MATRGDGAWRTVSSEEAGGWEHLPSLLSDAPDWHGVVGNAGCISAHGSLWWSRTPKHGPHRVGMLGHFFARNARDARALILAAIERLRREGCTLMVGPMNGSTWRNYRWVTTPGEEPPFFLEPSNPPEYPQYLEREGFQPIVRYFSALTCDMNAGQTRLARLESRFAQRGVETRSLSETTFDADIEAILALTTTAFRQNPFFDLPDPQAFYLQCHQLRKIAPLDHVRLAFHGDALVGFVFAVPDFCQAERGVPVDTLVVKTLAVSPEARYMGLGAMLLMRLKRDAAAGGYRRAIHALARRDCVVERVSLRMARPMRGYTLFGKVLEP